MELSAIARRYLEARFQLHAPEQTTEEFLRDAASAGKLSPAHQQLVTDFLEQSDLVKFARYQPGQPDMRAAYDALDDEPRAEIEDMICEHSLMYSRGSLGFLDYTEEEKQMFKPVLQRLVRTHPVHGRKSLYLSSHAGAILGMSMPEARLLLRDLTEHATQPQFVHVHQWTLHDLVMWDNRQTMHRVRRYDQSQPRDMRRATVAGTEPTVAQQAAE